DRQLRSLHHFPTRRSSDLTQSLLDDGKIMIDFSGDSYLHRLTQTIDYNDIEHLLITHWHSDHFYGEDLAYRMKGYAVGLDKKMRSEEHTSELQSRFDLVCR